MRCTSLLLVAATVAAMLLGVSAEAGHGQPAGEHLAAPAHHHIGTPAVEHLNAPAPNHIGTPASEHLAKQPHDHIGTPAAPHLNTSSPKHIGTPASQHLSYPPEDAAPVVQARRHHVKSRQHQTNGKITFYGGEQLLNPACPGARTPTDSSMTVAISNASPFHCGDRIKISDNKGNHAVVTVVDRCAGCTAEWIDVTKGVFRIFDSLDMGILHQMSFTKM